MKLSFKKRIASYFMLATAILITLVFGTVYFIVQQTVFNKLDLDLSFEVREHTEGINLNKFPIQFSGETTNDEDEHKEVEMNPIFMQIVDWKGEIHVKTPNLNEDHLVFNKNILSEKHFNAFLNNRAIRQIQVPLFEDGKIKAYILAAMSLDASLEVLHNLRNTLFILFPIVLLILYFATLFLAGRSIKPVVSIIETANSISKKNLNERIALPTNKDELHDLTSSINQLLNRIENAMQREKQFTSDASHELRTPLSVLRGTLEVLNRKPRSEDEYKSKIQASLLEIDRMATIIDQLLEVARIDADPELNSKSAISIVELIHQIVTRKSVELTEKQIKVNYEHSACSPTIQVNGFHANLIIENIVSNAIKYSHPNSEIVVSLSCAETSAKCIVKDFGIGIRKEDLDSLFQPFFRSQALNHQEILGSGLGLSIVQKAAQAISAEIQIDSEENSGTEVTIRFNEILRENK